MAGMLECVQFVKDEISALRNDSQFDSIVQECRSRADELELDDLQVPRARRPPARFTGPAECTYCNHSCRILLVICRPNFNAIFILPSCFYFFKCCDLEFENFDDQMSFTNV